MITIISALFMALIIFGMIKVVKHFSPDRAGVVHLKDEKTHRDFSEKSDKSQLDVQYDANKEMFTEMFDTEHKLKGNMGEEPELNLEMANTINILRRSPSPNMVHLTKKEKKNGDAQIENESVRSKKSTSLQHASGETKHKDGESSNN